VTTQPATYAEVEGFITMLLAAGEDPKMRETLQMLLSQSDERRRMAVSRLLRHLRTQSARQSLVDAIACLLDDSVAAEAYQVICGGKVKSK
jgi:hypothetical protein